MELFMNRIPRAINNILISEIERIEELTKSDVLAINGPIVDELLNIVLNLIENIKEKKGNLSVILTTNGGSAEVAERLVHIFRHHYEIVNFYVPDYAYSAGTILCMSGDDIYMDYHSVLGPIDPQVQNREGKFVPALGYLDKIDNLVKLARAGEISEAEFLILKDFDLAELKAYEQARDLTVDLLKEWLVKYKFKNWNWSESRNCEVTDEMKEERAKKIAEKLGNNNAWHSHGRPIDIDKLTSIGLKIKDFEEDKEVHESIREFHNLMIENMEASSSNAMVLTKEALK